MATGGTISEDGTEKAMGTKIYWIGENKSSCFLQQRPELVRRAHLLQLRRTEGVNFHFET